MPHHHNLLLSKKIGVLLFFFSFSVFLSGIIIIMGNNCKKSQFLSVVVGLLLLLMVFVVLPSTRAMHVIAVGRASKSINSSSSLDVADSSSSSSSAVLFGEIFTLPPSSTTIIINEQEAAAAVTTTSSSALMMSSNQNQNDDIITINTTPKVLLADSPVTLRQRTTAAMLDFSLISSSSTNNPPNSGGTDVTAINEDLHSVVASLELQRYGITVLLTVLVVYISIINMIAVTTLVFGMTSQSAALTIRMVCLRKKPISVLTSNNSPISNSNENSPAKSSLSGAASVTGGPGRRAAIIASSNEVPEEEVHFDSSAFPYLLSLAISDFLIGFLIAPLQLDIYINNRWRFSSDVCDFWLALDIFFSTSSTLHTAAIAVDRWWTITRLQSGSSPMPQVSLQKTMLIFIWMLAALVSFPVIYLWQIETPGQESRKRNPDQCEPVADDTYILLSTLVSFCLPLTLTIVFYVQTALRIRRQFHLAKLAIHQMALPFEEAAAVGSSSTDVATKQHAAIMISCRAEAIRLLEKHLQTLNHHRAMLRAMSLIVIVYCVCWAPLYTMLFVKAVCDCFVTIKAQHTWGQLVTMFSWLGYANSGINPIIYFVALDEFRALATAIIWIISERIRKTTAAFCLRIKTYLTAVFCCCSQQPIYAVTHRNMPVVAINSNGMPVVVKNNISNVTEPFALLAARQIGNQQQTTPASNKRTLKSISHHVEEEKHGRRSSSLSTTGKVAKIESEGQIASFKSPQQSSSIKHHHRRSASFYRSIKVDNQDDANSESDCATAPPKQQLYTPVSVPIQHKKFIRHNNLQTGQRNLQQQQQLQHQPRHYLFQQQQQLRDSCFSNPNLVSFDQQHYPVNFPPFPYYPPPPPYYYHYQQPAPFVIIGDGYNHRSQSSYAAFTDSWGRPLNSLSNEATV